MQRTKTGEFNWADLSAGDLEGQTRFYEGLLGWTHTDMPYGQGMIYRMFQTDGHNVAGAAPLPPEQIKRGRPSGWNSYLAADDVDAVVAKAAELGAEVIMPPGDVPDTGRIAAIKDPTGASISFWKPLRTDETVEYGPPGTLSWSELDTRDPQKAIDFYTKLLGWRIEPLPVEQMTYWRVYVDGEEQAGIMPMPEMLPAEVPSYWLPYFVVVDAKVSTARAGELGGTVLVGPVEVPGMLWFSVLADPKGAAFALMQPLMP
jgi:predicted enzyme related to lactoylglutathione lyase